MNQRGRNAGVTGVVDFPGLGSGVKFYCRVFGYKDSLSTTNKTRAGRNTTGKWRKVRSLISSGQVVLTGAVNTEGYPLPDTWGGQEGSLTITYASGKTKTVPCRVTFVDFSYSEKSDIEIKIAVTCDIINNPTLTGFGGSQPSRTEPNASDEEQWGGTNKTFDPKGLQDTSTRRVDVWGSLANTDTAEMTRIASVIAANSTPPMQYQKLRKASFMRDSDDGGEVTIEYGLTDTEEDVVNPRTYVTTDSFGLQNSAKGAAVGTTPGTPTGQLVRLTTTEELNDQKQLITILFGNRTTKDDIEFPGTVTGEDVDSLEDDCIITVVTQSSTPPSPPNAPLGEYTRRETEQLDRAPGNWKHVFHYGNMTSSQKVTFPKESREDDPSDLEDRDTRAQVTSSSTPPAALPSRISGLVLRRQISVRLSGTPERWVHVWEYAWRTTEQDITMLESYVKDSIGDLNSEHRTVEVTNSNSPLSYPADSLEPVSILSVQQTGGKWKHTYNYENTDDPHKIIYEGSETSLDSNLLQSKDQETVISGTVTTPSFATPNPATLVLRAVLHRRLTTTPEQWKHTAFWGTQTTVQDVTLPKYRDRGDPNFIDDEFVEAAMWTGSGFNTPPGDDTPANYQVLDREDVYITAGRRCRIITYGRNNSRDREVLPNWTYTVGGLNIHAQGERAYLDGDSTSSALTTEGGVTWQLRETTTKQVTSPASSNRVKTIYRYGLLSEPQEITFPLSHSTQDPIDGRKDTLVSIYSGTAASLATLAGTYMTTNQTHSSYASVTVTQLTPNRYVVKEDYELDDKKMHSWSNHQLLRQMRGLPTGGFGSPNGEILVQVPGPVVGGPGGFTKAKILPVYVRENLGSFKLRRVYHTDQPDNFFYLAIRGLVNYAPFLGFAAHEVMYVGPEVQYLYSRAGVHRCIIDYEFDTNNKYFVNDGYLPEGTASVSNAVSPFTTSGFYDLSYLSWAIGFDWPVPAAASGSGSFDGFMADLAETAV